MTNRTDAPMAPLLSGIGESSPTDRGRAVRALAARAHDADDLRQLLAMLGLDARDAVPPRGNLQRGDTAA